MQKHRAKPAQIQQSRDNPELTIAASLLAGGFIQFDIGNSRFIIDADGAMSIAEMMHSAVAAVLESQGPMQ